MSRISQLKDHHGNDIYFGNTGEMWLIPSPNIQDFREHMTKIRHMELRDDDIILASFPRSGTAWNLQVLYMLLHNTTDYLGHLEEDHLEWAAFGKKPRPDGPQIYATHLRYRLLPKQAREKKVKVIYCYRNPKDCWVSYYNFANGIKLVPSYEGTWAHFFDAMMNTGYWYGDWFDHVLEWEEAMNNHADVIFPSCYELMKKDPVGQIMKMDQFLGLNRGRELCEKIAKACQFSNMKAAKEPQNPEVHGEKAWKKGSPRPFRKGEIGDWKNWFTVAQSEQLDAVFKKRMSESKLPFIFE
ncbi:sulfotransferase 1C2-like isoform X1 [Babylonia areolata]|uniref:sulfotransferase 1C2-like isoform X1 n=2 Tax=Babylonia areolata TaxID=304850 RepID=UPI003FD680CA